MYSENDRKEMKSRITKYVIILCVLTLCVFGMYGVAIAKRIEWLMYVSAVAMTAVHCFMWPMYILPCIRYRRYLVDMETGLTRDVRGEIVEVSQTEEMQDGVRVLPVRVLLDEEQDERIIYIDASKADGFPKKGEHADFKCFGRHIKAFA